MKAYVFMIMAPTQNLCGLPHTKLTGRMLPLISPYPLHVPTNLTSNYVHNLQVILLLLYCDLLFLSYSRSRAPSSIFILFAFPCRVCFSPVSYADSAPPRLSFLSSTTTIFHSLPYNFHSLQNNLSEVLWK